MTTNGNQGAVYAFTGSGATWTLQQKLTRAGAGVGEALGSAVAVRGDAIVCGIGNYDGIVGVNQGMGVFFTRSGTTWSASDVFQPNETQAFATVGTAVAMGDEFVAVGATNWSRPGANFSGAAFAFRRAGGVPSKTNTTTSPTPQTDANYGNRMASSGNRLVVGAYNEDGSAGANQGAVYVYKFQDDCLVLEQKLLPSVQQADANFGRAVAIDGTTLVVGAPLENESTTDAGAVYVFVFNCAADFNCDNIVDDLDFQLFLPAYNAVLVPPANPKFDLNDDGVVEDADFVIFVQQYNDVLCP